jgi:hypothetical protein
MKQILLALLIGLVAGVIDIIPMIIMKLDRMFTLSALTMWIVVGLLVSKTNLVPFGWLNGMVVTLLVFLPLSFLIFRLDGGAIIKVLIITTILGTGVGAVSGLLIK